MERLNSFDKCVIVDLSATECQSSGIMIKSESDCFGNVRRQFRGSPI